MLRKCVFFLAIVMALLACCALGLAACSSGGKKCATDTDCEAGQYCATDGKCHAIVDPDGGDDGTDGADGEDAGDGDQGPPPCERDIDCQPDQVCDEASGDCVAGTTCSADYNCDIDTQFCDPDGKVCKTRSLLCEPCLRDLECADPSRGDMCITYPTGKFCGQACGTLGCPAGYVCDADSGSGSGPNPNQCRSNTGTCGNTFICHSDADCASNQVCNLALGTCVTKCIDDLSCPAGKKCHYTGHCDDPCLTDADCDGDLICCTPGRGFCDENSTGKCRPEGCVLHAECLLNDGASLGYCDKTTNTCMTGCRWGTDLLRDSDCRSGYKCTCNSGTASCDQFDCCADPGGECLCDPTMGQDCSQVNVCTDGVCEKIPCNERGDVNIACARNQVCCGWPLDEGYPCTSGVPDGECYVAPMEVYCAACGSDGDPCEVTGYGHGEPGVCLTDSGDSNTYCHLGCRDNQDCPATWSCKNTFIQGCEEAPGCQQQGSCCQVQENCDTAMIDEDGQALLACSCTSDADCPADINGFKTACEPLQVCDNSVNPPSCVEGMFCKFAKACQCSNCCSQLASGG